MRASSAKVRPSCIHLISAPYLRDKLNAGTACHAGSLQSATTGGNRGALPISRGGSMLPNATCLIGGGWLATLFVSLIFTNSEPAGHCQRNSGASARRDRIRSARQASAE